MDLFCSTSQEAGAGARQLPPRPLSGLGQVLSCVQEQAFLAALTAPASRWTAVPGQREAECKLPRLSAQQRLQRFQGGHLAFQVPPSIVQGCPFPFQSGSEAQKIGERGSGERGSRRSELACSHSRLPWAP